MKKWIRTPGFRPMPGVLRGRVLAMVERLGTNGASRTLGLSEGVLFRIQSKQGISPDIVTRVAVAVDAYERLEKRLAASGRVDNPAFKTVVPAAPKAPTGPTRTELADKFKAMVLDRIDEFDRMGSLDRESLACGFFLALGLEPDTVRSFGYLVTTPKFFEEGVSDERSTAEPKRR